jgi:hypothetical protein
MDTNIISLTNTDLTVIAIVYERLSKIKELLLTYEQDAFVGT